MTRITLEIARTVATALLDAALPTSDTKSNRGISNVIRRSAKQIRESLAVIDLEATVVPYLWEGRLAFTIEVNSPLSAYENEVIKSIHSYAKRKCELDRRVEINTLSEIIMGIRPRSL